MAKIKLIKYSFLTLFCVFLPFNFCSKTKLYENEKNRRLSLEKSNSTRGLLEEWSKSESQDIEGEQSQTPDKTILLSELRQRKGARTFEDTKHAPPDSASSSKLQTPTTSHNSKKASDNKSTPPISASSSKLHTPSTSHNSKKAPDNKSIPPISASSSKLHTPTTSYNSKKAPDDKSTPPISASSSKLHTIPSSHNSKTAPSESKSSLLSSIMKLKACLPTSELPQAQLPEVTDATYESIFFQSTMLIDALKEMQRLSKNGHGLENKKMKTAKSIAGQILREFKIKDETKRLFNEMKNRESLYHGRVFTHKARLREIFYAICKQFGQMGQTEKPNNSGDYKDSYLRSVTLGLSTEKARVIEIGYCHNDVEPNIYIMIAPSTKDEKRFFLAIDFSEDSNDGKTDPSRRILEHFHIRKDGREIRIYEHDSHLQESIKAYNSKRKAVDNENENLEKPNMYSYLGLGITPKAHTYNPIYATRMLFRELPQNQPAISKSGENFQSFDELCKGIGNIKKFGIHKGTEYSGDANEIHKIFLFESADKREEIWLLGMCKYGNKDTIYVYLAKKEEYRRRYLLAIRDNPHYTVVVNHFVVRIMKDFVHF